MTSDILDCVIVGAGFSGLSAGQKFKQAGKNFLIVEARDRVGGRVAPGSLAGLTIDLGGMWVGPTQLRLLQVLQDRQIRTYPTYCDGEAVTGLGGETARVPGEAFEKALPEAALSSFEKAATQIAEYSGAIDPAEPWHHPDAISLDAHTLQSWMEREKLHPAVQELLAVICQSVLCCEPGQISLLFFLFYVASAGSLKVLISQSEGGAQNLMVHGGMHQLALCQAEDLDGHIELNAPVSGVEWSDKNASIRIEDGRSFRARKVVLATPPALTASMQFDPPLPSLKRGLLRRQPMGNCIKVWLAYERPFWRDQGLSGLVLDIGTPITPIIDVSPPDQSNGILAGFFDADSAIIAGAKSPEARRQLVLDEIIAKFGNEGAQPLDYQERDWTQERWSEGCYGGYMAPGVMSRFGEALRAPVGPLHWAGTETATDWSGYIEGAIQAGSRAATEVLDCLGMPHAS